MLEEDGQSNLEAKRQSIRAYFEEIENRVRFLDELYATDHRQEALLLCCCYIDGLASGLYGPRGGSQERFVRVIREHGGNELLNQVHPVKLRIWLKSTAPTRLQDLREPLADLLSGRELVPEDEFCTHLATRITASQLAQLRPQLWRGTLASLAYEQLRSTLVHQLSAPDAIDFSLTTFRGERAPSVDFKQLRPVLGRVLETIKARSIEMGKWFGHDFKYS